MYLKRERNTIKQLYFGKACQLILYRHITKHTAGAGSHICCFVLVLRPQSMSSMTCVPFLPCTTSTSVLIRSGQTNRGRRYRQTSNTHTKPMIGIYRYLQCVSVGDLLIVYKNDAWYVRLQVNVWRTGEIEPIWWFFFFIFNNNTRPSYVKKK